MEIEDNTNLLHTDLKSIGKRITRLMNAMKKGNCIMVFATCTMALATCIMAVVACIVALCR